MEIPDLDYKYPKTTKTIQDVQDFYSVEDSQIHTEKDSSGPEPSFEDDFKPIIQDQIYKKTMNLAWQLRYFSLTSTRLLYYSDSSKKQIKGCFNLASLLKYNIEVKEEENELKLIFLVQFSQKDEKHSKELLILNFQSTPDRFCFWKKQLNQVLVKIPERCQLESPKILADGIINTQQKIQNINFWNRVHISDRQLLRYADHLDIVFFRSKKPIAVLHRLLMRSNFDHVGIFFKDSLNRLLVLEAIQSRGVWINQWSQMVPIFKQHYDQIAIKKLILPKSQKIDFSVLEGYINEVIGKKYELSISKLIMGEDISIAQDTFHPPKQKQNNNVANNPFNEGEFKKEKSYFCSELVADVYIKLGLIKGKKRNQFWPRDFEDNCIPLQKKAYLTPFMFLEY